MPSQRYLNDTEALLQMADGNLAAYRYLFDQHFPDLCNFLLIYLHSKETAEEVALEIFTHIWEKRETLQIKATFKAFLFAVAKNKAISHYRKAQKTIFTSLDTNVSDGFDEVNSQNILESQELRTIIEDAIAKLPEKSRQVYLMAWEENLSHKEIAEQLGITPKTVENHVGIALRKLRETLKPYYEQIFLLCLIHFIQN